MPTCCNESVKSVTSKKKTMTAEQVFTTHTFSDDVSIGENQQLKLLSENVQVLMLSNTFHFVDSIYHLHDLPRIHLENVNINVKALLVVSTQYDTLDELSIQVGQESIYKWTRKSDDIDSSDNQNDKPDDKEYQLLTLIYRPNMYRFSEWRMVPINCMIEEIMDIDLLKRRVQNICDLFHVDNVPICDCVQGEIVSVENEEQLLSIELTKYGKVTVDVYSNQGKKLGERVMTSTNINVHLFELENNYFLFSSQENSRAKISDKISFSMKENQIAFRVYAKNNKFYIKSIQLPIVEHRRDEMVQVTNMIKNATCLYEVRVPQAKNLMAADWNGFSDPYVKMTIQASSQTNKSVVKSYVCKKTLSPQWKPSAKYFSTVDLTHIDLEKTDQPPHISVQVEIFDRDRIKADDFLGSASLRIPLTGKNDSQEVWLDLSTTGQVQVVYKTVYNTKRDLQVLSSFHVYNHHRLFLEL